MHAGPDTKGTRFVRAGYDAGAEQLRKFFKAELQKFLVPDLLQTGKRIIDACLSDATTEEYNELVPMSYQYQFNNLESYEQNAKLID